MQRKVFFIVTILIIIGAVSWFWLIGEDTTTTPPTPRKQSTSSEAGQFNKQLHSLTKTDSLWFIANKQRPLVPSNYTPSDLTVPQVTLRVPNDPSMQMRTEAARAVERLVGDAKKAGIQLRLSSAFRSSSFQRSLYTGYVQTMGQAEADRISARPGHSEHQTGLVVDFDPINGACHLEACFGSLPEGKWLSAHAYKYGFVLRYHKHKENITGYTYEPWHFRYVGLELAKEVNRRNNPTLEEFFNLPAAPDYN